MFRSSLSSFLGKTIAQISRIRGGHGSALPGLVIERIDPGFLSRALSKLPLGVAVISGTNGKTTTTKMVVELLRSAGLRVFTNESGSNFSRGVASSAAIKMRRGKLNFDIAVLELDEAHAVKFVRNIQPDYSLLLNVLRDQLDRFGEIDTTAKMLAEIAKNTKEKLVVNSDDPRLATIAKDAKIPVEYFSFSPKLAPLFPTDEQLHDARISPKDNEKARIKSASVELIFADKNRATYEISSKKFTAEMDIFGAHNFLNAAAALAFARAILGRKFDSKKAVATVAKTKSAFGRGEVFELESGQKITLNLVKNPAGFRLVLQSADAIMPTLFAINDAYADGRDVSWLYDVNFNKFVKNEHIFTSGIRAYDMALRLAYDEVEVQLVESNLADALLKLINYKDARVQIFATYTGMLEIRKSLKHLAHLGQKEREI